MLAAKSIRKYWLGKRDPGLKRLSESRFRLRVVYQQTNRTKYPRVIFIENRQSQDCIRIQNTSSNIGSGNMLCDRCTLYVQ